MFFKSVISDKLPKPIGPYSPAIKLGDFVYLSGMLPVDQSDQVKGDIKEQTTKVINNIKVLLDEMNLELRHVVKTTVYMTDLNEFDQMNEVYGSMFTNVFPARTTIEVKALPKGAKLEIECFVIDTLNYEAQMQGCSGCDVEDCGDSCGCK